MIWEKIFREPFYGDRKVHVKTVPYLKDEIPYYTFIKQQKQKNVKQIIISSELMLKLIENTLNVGGEILKIYLSEKNDDIFQEEIDKLIENLRIDKKYFLELQQELGWVIGDQSIDISAVKILLNDFGVTITSDGILYGTENFDAISESIIIPTVEEYVNG